jgi:hypothetical protein
MALLVHRTKVDVVVLAVTSIAVSTCARGIDVRRGNGPRVVFRTTITLGSTLFPTSTMAPSPSVNDGQPSTRRRSRSPDRESRHDRKRHHHHTRRSRSPRRDRDEHRHKRHRTRSPEIKPVVLPYKAKPLSKRQYEDYKPLFQSYLDIQKNIQLDELDEREAKGRWKSFISRWYAVALSQQRQTY